MDSEGIIVDGCWRVDEWKRVDDTKVDGEWIPKSLMSLECSKIAHHFTVIFLQRIYPPSRKKQNIPKPNSHFWVYDFLAYPVWRDMNFLVSLEGMTLQSPRRITGADRRMPWHGDSPGWSHWDWSHEKCAVPWENRRFWGNVCIAWVGRCLNLSSQDVVCYGS